MAFASMTGPLLFLHRLNEMSCDSKPAPSLRETYVSMAGIVSTAVGEDHADERLRDSEPGLGASIKR